MPLVGIVPKTRVDGFISELLKHPDLFVACEDIGVIPYGYEIRVTCTGENARYGKKGAAVFVVTQFARPEHKAVVSGEASPPIIILDYHETLHNVEVLEVKQGRKHRILVVVTIYNKHRRKRRNLSWVIRTAEAVTVH